MLFRNSKNFTSAVPTRSPRLVSVRQVSKLSSSFCVVIVLILLQIFQLFRVLWLLLYEILRICIRRGVLSTFFSFGASIFCLSEIIF